MKNRGMHPQDLIALAAGAYAILCPLWTTTMIVLGAITVVLAIAELVRPDVMPIEGLTAAMGVLFFIAPWVMGFSDTRPMAWTAWIVGLITFVVGAADLQVTRSHRGTTVTTH